VRAEVDGAGWGDERQACRLRRSIVEKAHPRAARERLVNANVGGRARPTQKLPARERRVEAEHVIDEVGAVVLCVVYEPHGAADRGDVKPFVGREKVTTDCGTRHA
jgi:hypothetical protein